MLGPTAGRPVADERGISVRRGPRISVAQRRNHWIRLPAMETGHRIELINPVLQIVHLARSEVAFIRERFPASGPIPRSCKPVKRHFLAFVSPILLFEAQDIRNDVICFRFGKDEVGHILVVGVEKHIQRKPGCRWQVSDALEARRSIFVGGGRITLVRE